MSGKVRRGEEWNGTEKKSYNKEMEEITLSNDQNTSQDVKDIWQNGQH